MVISLPSGNDHAVRWLVYLMASSCVVFALLSFIEFSKPKQVIPVSQVLKVSLRTLAAPQPVVQKVEAIQKALQPVTKKTPPVVTSQQATKKIAPVAKEITPTTKPIVPVPKPKVIKNERPKSQPLTPVAVPRKTVEQVKKQTLPKVQSMADDKGKSQSTVIQNAKYKKQVPPVYPRRSYELGQQGTVMLHAQVLPNGKPNQLKVFKSSGHRRLDMAALSAVKKWEFENDGGTAMWVSVPVRFVIN